MIYEHSHLDCIKILIDLGADFKVKSNLGNNLIHLAAMCEENDFLEYAT
jgi:ankyrin repeat protein